MGVMESGDEMSKSVERNILLIEKAVESGQQRLAMRALRQTTPIRKQVTASGLLEMVEAKLSESSPAREATVAALKKLAAEEKKTGDAMETDEAEEKKAETAMETEETATAGETAAKELLPEVETYLVSLAAAVLCRERKFEDACELTTALISRVKELSGRRTVEPFAAKTYFYYALAHEKLGRFESIRPTLLALHRTACLKHCDLAQATLLNAVVRGLLEADLVEAAFKLVSKTTFPESASNNQFCRYLYYTGRIQAIQLDYTDAYTKLMQSMRKAPASTGVGFRRAVHQLAILVQLLMGELPVRSMFEGKGIRGHLDPYLRLTLAVRKGTLTEFNAVLQTHAARFKLDNTFTLALRLSQNVVKTGLRQINISYSRIALSDVTAKLQLESDRSTEFVIAKAIKDGVIDATIDHDNQWMCSNQVADVYATDDPQKAFHRRIAFCLDVHNEAVKAMMYPPDAHKKTPPPDSKNDESKTDEELAKEIEDELSEDPPI